MKKKNAILILSVIILFSFSQYAAARIEIPEGASVVSATLGVNGNDNSGQTVHVHQITGEWFESEVTWDTRPAFNTNSENTFVSGSDWRTVDLTDLVQRWVNGSEANHGVMLEQDTVAYTTYKSSEYVTVALRPRLEICYYTENPNDITCVIIQRQGDVQEDVADAWVWDGYPDNNSGGSTTLYTGLYGGNSVKQTLIRFDFDLVSLSASLGDRVWEDANGNGIQDEGESGFPGVTVHIHSCVDGFTDSTQTDETGMYKFEGLNPGDYSLEFVLPDGYFFSPRDQGSDDESDSDVYPSGLTECTVLESGEHDLSWDAGLLQPGCGDCEGKVTQLTLTYNGVTGAVVRVDQKDKNGGSVFNEFLEPGETFTFNGTDKNGTLGTEIAIYLDGDLNTKIHTSCSQPIGPGLVSGDFEVVGGQSRKGGLLCPLTIPEEKLGECRGKVTRLDLRYVGDNSALVRIDPKDKNKDALFDSRLSPGETFSIVGQDKKGTLGTEIAIYVDGIENARIHTSCSRPIGSGMLCGDFAIIGGYSKDGGKLPPF